MNMQLPLPGFPAPTHTETALKIHDLWCDDTGAYLQLVGVWTGRFPTIGDACQFAERVRANV